MKQTPKYSSAQAGFSLVECLVAIVVLTVIMIGVFSAVNKAQGSYRVENRKVDTTQQQREFLDQFTRDLHQAGFPTPASQGLPTPVGGFSGITLFPTSTDLTMQGDVDGTGVATIEYVYNPPNAPTCGCLQRIVNGVPTTAVENVAPPSAQEIFTGYDISGGPPVNLAAIRSVRITFTVQSGNDVNGAPIVTTITGMARLPNNN